MIQEARANVGTGVARRSMIVLTDIDTLGAERRRATEICAPAIRMLADHDVPVVFLSRGDAPEVVTLQKALSLREPFLCEGGRRLHVPGGYFEGFVGMGRPGSDWNVIEFGEETEAPDVDRALRLLTLLFWKRREDGIVIGLTDRNAALLEHADVRIVVKNRDMDQSSLRAVPGVYFTEAEGAAGWAEAIVGQVDV